MYEAHVTQYTVMALIIEFPFVYYTMEDYKQQAYLIHPVTHCTPGDRSDHAGESIASAYRGPVEGTHSGSRLPSLPP